MTSKNTISTRWTATLIDSGDGSGDMMIELPEDLLEQMNLHIGDTIKFEVFEDTSTILIRKINLIGG